MDYDARVVDRIEVAPGLIIIRVVPDQPLFPFDAGQYVSLGLKRSEPRVSEADPEPETDPKNGPGAAPFDPEQMIRRAYSIASSSRIGEYIEFYISLVPSGDLTPRIFRLPLNGRIHMSTRPKGLFTLSKIPPERHALLIATGTGLAPYMSMLRSELESAGERRFVVLHGARYSSDLGYRKELTALARRFPRLTYIPVVSRPQEDPTWVGPAGYLQDILVSGIIEERTGLEVSPAQFHAFLCGNPRMIEEAKPRLLERGFEQDRPRVPGTIHTEEYW
jgi:ferredoxin/flavodoxin---NADP+ reductase